jgi:flagellar hook-associated protein 1 FlgK
MSLTQALNISASGLRVAQAGLALVSSNVANADTPGYVRKTLVQTAQTGGTFGSSVSLDGVNRELDQYIQRQLRVEMGGGSYAALRAQFYARLQALNGEPGSDAAVETVFNNFTSALQALGTSPDSAAARSAALSAAQALAQQLNSLSAGIQGLRADAESGLADATATANAAMQSIARLNQQLAGLSTNDPAAASLLDQRDRYVDQLAQLMDVRVVPGSGNNQVSVYTNSGVQLVGLQAARLEFQPQQTMNPQAAWSADPAERSVGTVMLISAGGASTDLLATNAIRSGTIAAYADMRDNVLVGAQAQLDSFAAAMSQALSDRTDAGTAVGAGAQNGFDLDLAGLLAGNTMRIDYADIAAGAQKSVTFVRVDDAAALPLDPGGDPDNRVVGIDFSGGPAAVAAQVAAALGADFTVSNPSGTTLRILDDGGTAVALNAARATRTVTGFASGNAQLPLFLDGSAPYTGAPTGSGAQITGLAGRIAVNPAALNDPSKLVLYASGTLAGDSTRPDFLYGQLSQASLSFAGAAAPSVQTLPAYLRQMFVQQGQDAAAASSLSQGQSVVVDALQQRMNATSQVSIDQEMTTLLALQSAYSANARVMSAVKDMLDILANM